MFAAGNHGPISERTVWRYMQTGLRGTRLPYSFAGGRRVIDVADIAEFQRAINAGRCTATDATVDRAVRLAVAREWLRQRGFATE